VSRCCRQFLIVALALFSSLPARAALQDPEAFLGHPVGQDRALLSWNEIVDYMRHVAQESDRAELIELGRSTQDRPFVMMVLSDAEGVANHGSYRARVRELYRVDETSEARAREIADEGKAIVAFSLGVHSTEVGAPQASLEMVHAIVSDETSVGREIRKNLLTLIVPCMNPDGLEIVRQWYERTKGSDAEGSGPLDLYHPYAGHDNNRDGFFNNLVETSYWSRVLYHDWLPQMIVDEHQMGSSGPRLFLPPFDDPVSGSVHPLVYSQLAAAGQQVVSDLTALGHEGIATQTIFTAEWPGSVRSTGFWHNMLGILSEVASARLATPLHFAPGSLQARGRGLSDYERRTNFLEPWEGGWWRLRDIIDLELDLTQGFLRWAAQHRADLLLHFWQMNRDAVHSGREEAPFAFVIPRVAQDDRASAPRMVEILRAGGIEVDYAASELSFGDYRVEGGAWVVRADQPFRPFLLEMLGQTDYPMVRDDSGKVIQPYDVTAWSLPLLLGAKVLPVNERASLLAMGLRGDVDHAADPRVPTNGLLRLSARDLRSFGDANRWMAAGAEVRRQTSGESSQLGDFIVDAAEIASHELSLASESWQSLPPISAADLTEPLRAPRVGLFAPFGGSMDEGWTRLVLERHGFSVRRIRPGQPELAEPEDGERLRQRMDVLVLPSIGSKELSQGRQVEGQARMQDALWTEEFRRGLGGPEAGAALKSFVAAGGTLVVLNHAVPWAVENMGLPVAVGLDGVDRDQFYAPGTLVRATVDAQQPVAWGMPREAAFYFASGYTLRPLPWSEETDVVATYSKSDLRLAGFLQGAERLEGRPALVDIPLQDGRVILFGFSPQRRAQTEGTFKLLFNAILRAGAG
jgi:Zinc carboxypeptidase